MALDLWYSDGMVQSIVDAKKKQADRLLRQHIEDAYTQGLNPLPFLRRKYPGLWLYNPTDQNIKEATAVYEGKANSRPWVIAYLP